MMEQKRERLRLMRMIIMSTRVRRGDFVVSEEKVGRVMEEFEESIMMINCMINVILTPNSNCHNPWGIHDVQFLIIKCILI
jgi:hypothetical protein